MQEGDIIVRAKNLNRLLWIAIFALILCVSTTIGCGGGDEGTNSIGDDGTTDQDGTAQECYSEPEIMTTEEGKAAMKLSYQWSEVIEKDDTFYDGFRATLDASGVDVTELAQ